MLAVATFSSVKSANRSARVAERSLLAGLRPVLISSREDDPPERLRFGDDVLLTVPGHGGALKVERDVIYMAIGLRNGGSGIAVIPAGDIGFWFGAIRDRDDPAYRSVRAAVETRSRVTIDVLYGDHEGGQRTISRFAVSDWPEVDGERAQVLRHWNVDRDNPRAASLTPE